MKTQAAPQLAFSLDGNFDGKGGTDILSVQGAHRFIKIGEITGYQPTSLKTAFHLKTDLHLKNEGSIALWVSPLETLGTAAAMRSFESKDRNAQQYGLVGDTLPINDPAKNIFAWYWRSFWHPQMIAKFKNGAAAGGSADFAATPYVPVEHLPLHERQWYEFILTWNKEKSRLYIYVNGILCGTTLYPFRADTPRPDLYLGNTAMVFANLRMYDRELTAEDAANEWHKAPFSAGSKVQDEIEKLHTIQPKPKIDWQPDKNWRLAYDSPLRAQDSFSGWTQEGCLEPGHELKECKITPEGLLLETPDRIGVESRVYFWSPQSFEGDLAVQFDFCPGLDTGLALLVVQASGMQREDILNDMPRRTTGSMGTIIGDRIRNYHWEFFRHAVDVRGDVGTQVLVKNPWQCPLGLTSRPLLKPGTWHHLLFVQEGNRLRAAIDGECLFDVCDTPLGNNGPVFNSGRIGLRLMYQTRMLFRDMKIWNRERRL